MIFGTTSIKIKGTLLKSRIQEIKSISNQYIQSSGYQEPIKIFVAAYSLFLHTAWWSFPKPAKLDLASWSFTKPAKLKLDICPCQNKYGLSENLLVLFSKAIPG